MMASCTRMWPWGQWENGEILDVYWLKIIQVFHTIVWKGSNEFFGQSDIGWEHQMALLMDRKLGCVRERRQRGL